jgi:hypothetical protein
MKTERSGREIVIAGWATLAVASTLVEASLRLGARAIATARAGLDVYGWAWFLASVVLFGYFEGERALRRRFAPFVVARAFEAALLGSPYAPVFAPLRALGLIGAPPVVLGRAWLGVAMIVAAVHSVSALPSPWRGIVDAGVATALWIGVLALAEAFVHQRKMVA